MTTGTREQGRAIGGISRPTATWLAWSMCAVCVIVMVLTLLFQTLTPSRSQGGPSLALYGLFAVSSVSLPAVGALIVSRHPRNPIGWIFCATGLVVVVGVFANEYSGYAVAVHGGSLVGAKVMAWFASWTGDPTLLLSLALLFLLFPTGRLPSRRWRPVLWSVIVGSAMFYLASAVTPGPLLTQESFVNPVGITGALGAVFGLMGTIGLVILLIACLASALSLIVRLRRGSAQERQQLKWVVYPAAISVVGSVVAYVGAYVFGSNLINAVGYWIAIVAFLTLPVFTAFAVLKYRLYDIDRIINRTLVYGSLTGSLALVYFGGVTATQVIFQRYTGQEDLPQLVTVASTLVIAALFGPLRRRVQGFVDRRFYRKKYDATRTLAAFNARLRDETELDTLSGDLVGVVKETMQPAHVSVWLRPVHRTESPERAGESHR